MKKNRYWFLLALACTGGLGIYLYHRHHKHTSNLDQVDTPLTSAVFSQNIPTSPEENSSIIKNPSSIIKNFAVPSITTPIEELSIDTHTPKTEDISVPILIPNEFDEDEEKKILKFRQLANIVGEGISNDSDEQKADSIIQSANFEEPIPPLATPPAENITTPNSDFIEPANIPLVKSTSSPDHSPEVEKSVFDEIMDYAKQFPEFIIPGKDIQRAEPAILFAYSNHLYTLGRKDEATFWFYLAQFRTRYLTEILKAEIPVSNNFFVRFFRESGFVGNLRILSDNIFSESPETQYQHLNTVYDSATRQNILVAAKGLGEVINNYAYQNIHKQVQRLQDVVHFEEKFPFQEESLVHPFDLIPPIDRVEIKEKIACEVEEAQRWLLTNYDRVREVRRQRGLPND